MARPGVLSSAADHFRIEWIDTGREPQCPPNPAYPDGKDIPSPRHGEPGFRFCVAQLPYPAKRCGVYIVKCLRCGFRIGVTTAGRVDDPKSVEIECQG
jgi:hypothetical protein